MRESDAGVACGEVRHLLPPRQVVAAQAVREDDRRAFARDLVVELGIAAPQAPGRAFHLSNAFRAQCFAFTAPFGALPLAMAPACATVSIDWCSIAGRVSPAVCGVAITSARAASRGVGIWSGARPTSIAQPARWPEFSAASSACSSTRLPRETLMR